MIDLDLLYRVAHDYYIKKKLQREIAKEYQVSRVQISKYISMAEEQGIVKIDVVRPSVDSSHLMRLKEEFLDAFAIENILISPSYGNQKSLEETIHILAEEYIFSHFTSAPMQVGIGWGSTTYNFVSKEFSELRTKWRVYPLTGGSSLISSKYFNINHIAHTFADKIGGSAQLVYLPLLVDHANWETVVNANDDYRLVQNLWSNIDLIISSIGYSIPRSPLFRQGLIGEEYMDKLRNNKVVGDILTHYFDEKGNFIQLGIEKQFVNISIEQILQAKKKLIIAFGKEKIRAILGGLRTKMIDVLVTDADTARDVLELYRQQ